jgi:hypothetical protein
MEERSRTDSFIAAIHGFARFEDVVDPETYVPLPEGWALATTDIVGSTDAIAGGLYKSVNMAGASMISALLNALGRRDLPFVFGGDGAVVAIPGDTITVARDVLAATRTWVGEELGLTMRAAVVPVEDIRRNGFDVRVASYMPSPDVGYAMFAGGGTAWAEAEMKAGRYGVPAAPPGTRPDLTGLSCRWNPIEARHGEIVSIIAVPASGPDPGAFRRLVTRVLAMLGTEERDGHPIAAEGPTVDITFTGLEREVSATAASGHRFSRKLVIIGQILILWVLARTGMKLRGFTADGYRRAVAENSDFRKFDDGLKMTVDLDAAKSAAIEAVLREAEMAGICRYGIHRQSSALMTCIVASPLKRNHIHFIDGAAGGYAMAAANLKAKAA